MTKKRKTQSTPSQILIKANANEFEFNLEGEFIGWAALLIIALERCPELEKSMHIALEYINEKNN
jgi:hypothetical protein